ncbi:toll-like receptor 13 [Scomber scombrus]|uniref:toll-like receptor 13 n=1 Tax=Scomber scombrus TaxID=13677 RepID=UPI002DD937C3|nr:toll-like receptor 13 [Scomber scombrus]
MALGVKEDNPVLKGGSKWSNLSIIFLFLSISCFVVPATGFALKYCRISYNNAICSNVKLHAVPQDIPSTVTGFDLSGNKISKIEVSDFKNLPILTVLDLGGNNISQIDKGAFANLISLNKLNLNGNKLTKLEDGTFDGLSNLTELRIKSNKITAVASSSFKPLTNLKTLDISFNVLKDITIVSSIFQHLPRLQELIIKKSYITIFQSWELTNTSVALASLDLSQNPIRVFRFTADVFPNLTRLNLGDSPRKKNITWEVRNKTFLRVATLDISELCLPLNDTKTLLESFDTSLTTLRMNKIKRNVTALINVSCTIPTLTTLKLQNNNLNSSDLFQACINLTEIDLAENQIKNVSDKSFRTLRGLMILSLRKNKLSAVPSVIRTIPTLVELDLSSNLISALDCHDFANMTRLKELSLKNNTITELKECLFKDLIRLQVLRLQTNKITKLNSAFSKHLPYLERLHLNGNQLDCIKEGYFKGLQGLKNLSLYENKITRLGKNSFIGMKNLTDMLLQYNKITDKGIHKSSFKDLINLRTLDLRENLIFYGASSALRDPPFSLLSRLESLSLLSQHHRKKSPGLPCNILEGLTNLLYFNIRNTELLSLRVGMFNYTPQLQHLDISSNDLSDVSPDLFAPIQNLTTLYISRTNLLSLDFLLKANLSKLQYMQARKNQFSVIREDVINSLPALEYVDLQGNSFTCDCDNALFVQWVENNNQTQVFDAYNFVCNYPPNVKGMKLLDLDMRSCTVDTGFICFVSTTCTILLFMLTSFIYHFLRWQMVYAYYLFLALLLDKKNKKSQNQYDAFISYNTHDEPWVVREMLPKLEGEQGWKLCLHHRDFQPGRSIIDNITDAIYGSRKTICVVSRKYLESEWCSREIQAASFRLFEEQKDVLIMVFLEEIPMSHLAPYYRMRKLLKRRTYLSWPKARDHAELFWEKVRQALETNEDPNDDRFLLRVVDKP